MNKFVLYLITGILILILGKVVFDLVMGTISLGIHLISYILPIVIIVIIFVVISKLRR